MITTTKEQLDTSKEEVSTLTANLTTIKASLDTANASVTDLTTKLNASTEESTTAKTGLVSLQAKFDALFAEHNTLKASVKSAEEQAMNIAAGQGVPAPLPVTPTEGNPSAGASNPDLVGQLNKLKGAEQRAFYIKHQAEISAMIAKGQVN